MLKIVENCPFEYWYNQKEIEEFSGPLEHLAREAAGVHVVFNTNIEEQGQVNAQLMIEALQRDSRGARPATH